MYTGEAGKRTARSAIRCATRQNAAVRIVRRAQCHHWSVTLDIHDSEAANRYEAREDGELAGFLDYVARRDYIALIHTETLASHQGRGIGERLVRFALDDARRRSLRVIATCPYVRAFVERHPEVQDIVVGMDAAAGTTDPLQPGDA
jgi:uncharacterized protein